MSLLEYGIWRLLHYLQANKKADRTKETIFHTKVLRCGSLAQPGHLRVAADIPV